MNIHSCSSKRITPITSPYPNCVKTVYSITLMSLMLAEKNYQVTFTFMENQENTLNNIDIMKVDEHTFMLIKNCYINKFSIPKLSENSPFQFSNITHVDRNNYQVTIIFMENTGNSLKITEIMKVNELHQKLITSIKFPYPN